jgi:hypothetical protein
MKLFQEIALTLDFSEHGLRAGNVAVLLDLLPRPDNGEEGCLLEVFNVLVNLLH